MKATPTKLDLDYLLAPYAADFFATHWQKSALLIKPNDAGRFHSLMPGSDIDEILAFATGLPSEAVELVGNTRVDEKLASGSASLSQFFRDGATIRIRGIHEHSAPLRELCKEIERQLAFPTRANLYCTPPGSRGFNLHFDTHEVIVLQLLGRKRWEVYEPVRGDRPEHRDVAKAAVGRQVLNEVLEQGDFLYLPSGFVHQAESLNEPSVHLTIGIHVADAESSEGTRVSAADLENLNTETCLVVNGELRVYLSAAGDMAALNQGERSFWMPMAFAPVFRFVAEQKEFRLDQLPGTIGEQGKLALVKKLLEDGFLRVKSER